MNSQQIRYELQHVISGKSGASYDPIIQTALSYLRASTSAGPMAQGKLERKEQEAAQLIGFAEEYGLRLWKIPDERFISNGAEQRVYKVGDDYVLKLNDAIYYSSWQDYLHNLLLHNYFFSDTAYDLSGFYVWDGVVYAVVKQAFVQADSVTDLNEVKDFLAANGFMRYRNNDYRNAELGLILEDLHDENVLTAGGMLYFIDTVFYIVDDQFWS